MREKNLQLTSPRVGMFPLFGPNQNALQVNEINVDCFRGMNRLLSEILNDFYST